MWRKFIPRFGRRAVINLIAVAIIFYFGFSTLQVIARNYRLQQQIDSLQNEIALVNVRNQELEYQIAYFQTDSFADKEARDKLNLQAPGEKVVIFPNRVPTTLAIYKKPPAQSSVRAALSNLQQWWYFIFKK